MGVHVVQLPNGDLQLGAEVDGHFVPFASQSAARVAQYQQRAQDLAERAEAGDELARDQIGKPLGSGDSTSKPVSKWNASELDDFADVSGVDDYPYDGTVAEKRAAVAAHNAAEAGEA